MCQQITKTSKNHFPKSHFFSTKLKTQKNHTQTQARPMVFTKQQKKLAKSRTNYSQLTVLTAKEEGLREITLPMVETICENKQGSQEKEPIFSEEFKLWEH